MSFTVDEDDCDQIKVYLRIRPLKRAGKETEFMDFVNIITDEEMYITYAPGKIYSFNKIFGPKTHQRSVYETVVKPLLPKILDGYHCTVFVYGQTGSGKTYTMAGASHSDNSYSWNNTETCGIIPRALDNLFDEIRVANVEYCIKVSYIELYNEEVFDLLDDTDPKPLKIFEDAKHKGSVILHGAKEVVVFNKYDVYNILEQGTLKRHTAETLTNHNSSRSHTIFSVKIQTIEKIGDEVIEKMGKLYMVDLAGSEDIGKSGAVNERARETRNINQSLLTLGRVIKAIVEKSPHIPFRSSKLTRILQDSLGGGSITSIIATISPSLTFLKETLNTLDYAQTARNIINKPEMNRGILLNGFEIKSFDEIEYLNSELNDGSNTDGIRLPQDYYLQLLQSNTNFNKEFSEKEKTLSNLSEKLKLLEQQIESKEEQYADLENSLSGAAETLDELKKSVTKVKFEKLESKELALSYETSMINVQKQLQDVGVLKATLSKKRPIFCTKLAQTRNHIRNNNTLVDEFAAHLEENCFVIKNATDVLKNKISEVSPFAKLDAYNENASSRKSESKSTHLNLIQEKYLSNCQLSERTESLIKSSDISKPTKDFLQHFSDIYFNSKVEVIENLYAGHQKSVDLIISEIKTRDSIAINAISDIHHTLEQNILEMKSSSQNLIRNSTEFNVAIENTQNKHTKNKEVISNVLTDYEQLGNNIENIKKANMSIYLNNVENTTETLAHKTNTEISNLLRVVSNTYEDLKIIDDSRIFYDTIMTEKGAQFYSEMTKYKDMSEIEDLSNKLTNLIISRQTTNEKILNECQNIVKKGQNELFEMSSNQIEKENGLTVQYLNIDKFTHQEISTLRESLNENINSTQDVLESEKKFITTAVANTLKVASVGDTPKC